MRKIFLDVNGIKQGLFLQGEDKGAPVLLFLHGGPGSPEVALNNKYPSGLEKIFNVCWWDNRGSGLSYNNHLLKEDMTVEQMISDTVVVAHYLKEQFNQEKIHVMGHSFGSMLGILTAYKYPQLFHAYIGVGQIKKNTESEFLAYNFMLNEYRKKGDKRMVLRLEKFDIKSEDDMKFDYIASVRSKAMDGLGIGMMRKKFGITKILNSIISFKGYSLKEKWNYIIGSNFSAKHMLETISKIDLSKEVQELQIPIYIFQGKFDYQTSYVLAKQYFTELKAPIKGFYTFNNSAHSPCFEEAEKMCSILRQDVLQGKVDFADNI